MKRFSTTHGIDVTALSTSLLGLNGSPQHMAAFVWMKDYFGTVGDYQPNRDGEIHLEKMDKIMVYNEYITDFGFLKNADIIKLRSFYTMWEEAFKHVKIREYKDVGGKCTCCANLSECRRRQQSRDGRQEVTILHSFHRTTYMAER